MQFYNSFYYKGWRPTIGWVLTLALLVYFVLQPLAFIVMGILDSAYQPKPFDHSVLTPLVTLVLGSKIIRSYDKSKESQDV